METTDFGYERVSPDEKTRRVRGVFDSVARRYDVMNDLMSFGLHRGWKRFALEVSGVRAGRRVLDLASGTGDLAKRFAQRVGPRGTVVHTDVNAAMLLAGRDRLLDEGFVLPTAGANSAARSPVPPARSSTRWPGRTPDISSVIRLNKRWVPNDMRSFMTS